MKYYDCPCSGNFRKFIFSQCVGNFENIIDPNNPKCECWDAADQLLTDYTWYCNQRKFLTYGKYSKGRKNPIYATLLSQPEPETLTGKSIHGIGRRASGQNYSLFPLMERKYWTVETLIIILIILGEFFYFGTRYRTEMKRNEINWARAYQNYLSNFIRTSDPNGKVNLFYGSALTNFLDWTGSPNVGDLKSKENMAKVKFTEYDGKWFKLGKNKFEKQKKDPRNKKCNMFDKINQYMLH